MPWGEMRMYKNLTGQISMCKCPVALLVQISSSPYLCISLELSILLSLIVLYKNYVYMLCTANKAKWHDKQLQLLIMPFFSFLTYFSLHYFTRCEVSFIVIDSSVLETKYGSSLNIKELHHHSYRSQTNAKHITR